MASNRLYVTLFVLFVAVVHCSALKDSVVPREAAALQKAANLFTDTEKMFARELTLRTTQFQMITNYLIQVPEFRLNLNYLDKLELDSVKKIPLFWKSAEHPGEANPEEVERYLVSPCRSIQQKLASTVEAYRQYSEDTGDLSMEHLVVYHDICKLLVSEQNLASELSQVFGENFDKQTWDYPKGMYDAELIQPGLRPYADKKVESIETVEPAAQVEVAAPVEA